MRSTLTRVVTASLLVLATVDAIAVAGAPLDGRAAGSPDWRGSPANATDWSGGAPPLSELATVEGFDDVEIQIEVASDRSATWRVRYRYRLDDESAERAFERSRANVSNPPGVFIERMRKAAQRAERRTGREMSVGNGSVAAFQSAPHGRFGIVEYRFTWTGFARSSEDGRMVVGDALTGYPLDANESLVFDWETDLQAVEVTPPPNATSESAVRWDGPHEFSVDAPRLVLATTGSGVVTPLSTVALGGVVALVAIAVLVYGVGTDRLAALVGTGGEAAEAAEEETERETPTELLSDEERVIGLLEENGGRMKQQAVKEELDWSRTKTSNVVNDLQDEGRIEVYRLGRENTLALPGEIDL